MSGAVTHDGWSAYDDAVPHTTGLPSVVERAAALRRLRPAPAGATLADVGQVVVVVSSSRGGSTLLGQVLRQVPGLLHLSAEVNPLFTLAGLSQGVDRRQVLEDELLRDLGAPPTSGVLEGDERDRLLLDHAWRLTVQWPATVDQLPLETLVGVLDDQLPPAGCRYDPGAVQLAVLTALQRVGAAVDARYYDLDPSTADLPAGTPPLGPPGEEVVEMPPFVAVNRWRPASADELRALPVVLCTPRLSFRLGFLRDLFPAAALRVVHLTRNPAASVNGLMDGWLHHGFFNCRVPGGLSIDGYSGEVPGGDEWWCYDFPPDWREWTSAPLPEVCAFQWRATHEAAADGCDGIRTEPLRLRFEDVVGEHEDRLRAGAALAPVLGVGEDVLERVLTAELPVVMATAQPAPARWRDRVDVLRRVLEDPAVLDMAHRLGYDQDRADWV